MYIASVEIFMLGSVGFTFSLSCVGKTPTGITLFTLLGIRDNCAQNYRNKG